MGKVPDRRTVPHIVDGPGSGMDGAHRDHTVHTTMAESGWSEKAEDQGEENSAGVSGLTSAYLLSKQRRHAVTVVAKHMPGDYDIEYGSPWAGANMVPMSTAEDNGWEVRTWPELRRLAVEEPEAGIHLQRCRLLRRFREDAEDDGVTGGARRVDARFVDDPWYRRLMDDYRELARAELPDGIASGCEFGSVCINPALYLAWLVGKCRANGVVLKRATLAHVSEAAALSHTGETADVVVNATGLLASKLGGVMDDRVKPVRGQVVMVRNEAAHMLLLSGTAKDGDPADEICYIMTRAGGGGTVLGGTYTPGSWESQPDANIATRIMARAVENMPQLANGKGIKGLDVIRHAVGLRPYREGGVRIDREKMGGTWIVSNYGHGGWGYQGSYGCAERVVELVEEVLSNKL